ncbi:MAG: hypothetical protein ACJ78Q_06635 [Chloroflexia bacterium]
MPELLHKIQYLAAEGLGDGWYYRLQRLPAGGIFVKYEANLVHLNAAGYVEEEVPCTMEAITPDAAIQGLNAKLRPLGFAPELLDYNDHYPIGA